MILAVAPRMADARARTSPRRTVGGSAVDRWITLVCWLDAVREMRLFAVAGLDGLGRRDVARYVLLALAARGGHSPGADLASSAFAGACAAA